MFSSNVDTGLPLTPTRVADAAVQRELLVLYNAIRNLQTALTAASSSAGTGDVVTATANSQDGGLVVFSGVGGKTITKTIDSGIVKLVNGVVELAIEGIGKDYLAGTTQHDDLQGLNVANYQHLSAAEKTGLVTGVDTLLHSHKWPTISDVVDAGETVTIPANRQLIVTGGLANDGTIMNDGLVYIL